MRPVGDQCYPAVVVGGVIVHWHRPGSDRCTQWCHVTNDDPPV